MNRIILFNFCALLLVGAALPNIARAESLESKLDRALHAIEQLSVENRDLKKRLDKLETSSNSGNTASQEKPTTTDHQQKMAYEEQQATSDYEDRISDLEESSSSSVIPSLLEKVSIYGYSSFEYERQINSQGFGDPNGSFDADLFDIVINVQVNDKLRATADITWEHGAASEDDRGNVALEYGFAEYAFTDLFKLRAGKMFTPFGIFNEIHTAKPTYLSVKEAASTNKPKSIIPGAPRFYPRWGVGPALQGDGNLFDKHIDYNLMLTNGEQEDTNPFEEDNNTSKAVNFRARYDLTDNLLIGSSFYYDDGVAVDTMSVGAQFEYNRGSFRLLGEGVWGKIDPMTQTRFHHLGWFVQPSYEFDNGLTPYFRFEHYDPNTDISEDHGFNAILGINFNYNNLIFKLENNYFFGGNNSVYGRLPGNGYNEFKGAIVVGF